MDVTGVGRSRCAAAGTTRDLFGGVPLSELGDYLQLMGLFDRVFTVGGLGMLGTLVER